MPDYTKPMLLKDAPLSTLVQYLEDPDWLFQPKIDGRRVLIHNEKQACYGRDGQYILSEILPKILNWDSPMRGFDTELVNGVFYVFDVIPWFEASFFENRYLTLKVNNYTHSLPASMKIVPLARGYKEKLEMTRKIMAYNGEGIVARHKHGLMEPGVRSSHALKLKMVKEIDVWLRTCNDEKDHLEMVLWKDNEAALPFSTDVQILGTVKNVHGAIPGDVATVRYLRISDSGRLVQPRLTAIRWDKPPRACLLSQLRPTDQDKILNEGTVNDITR